MNTLNNGDVVSHPDYPNALGSVSGKSYHRGKAFYKVTWSWPASPGPVIHYAVENNALEKA